VTAVRLAPDLLERDEDVAEEHATYTTKTGKVLTDTDVEALADEAEDDYDVEAFKPRARSAPSTEGAAPEMPPRED
jgi:hypothetical protein